MKVWHVITGLEAGGAEVQLATLLRHTRHQSDVVTLYNPGSVAERIRADGTRVRDIGMTRNTQLGALLTLRSIIADGRYDVVHTHLYRTQIYARPAARLARTPVVVTTEHSIGETHIEGRKMTAGVRGLYLASELFSDATIAVSNVVKERLVRWGVPAKKIIVIPRTGPETAPLAFNPAKREQARQQFGIGPDTYVIGALGRIDENKRVDYDRGCRADSGRAVQDPRNRPRRVPNSAGGRGRPARGGRPCYLRRLPARHGGDDVRFRSLCCFLGPGDIRAGHTRSDGQRPTRGLYCLPGAGRDPYQSGSPSRRDSGGDAGGDPQGGRSRAATAPA